jgi:hypothetical protein
VYSYDEVPIPRPMIFLLRFLHNCCSFASMCLRLPAAALLPGLDTKPPDI